MTFIMTTDDRDKSGGYLNVITVPRSYERLATAQGTCLADNSSDYWLHVSFVDVLQKGFNGKYLFVIHQLPRTVLHTLHVLKSSRLTKRELQLPAFLLLLTTVGFSQNAIAIPQINSCNISCSFRFTDHHGLLQYKTIFSKRTSTRTMRREQNFKHTQIFFWRVTNSDISLDKSEN